MPVTAVSVQPGQSWSDPVMTNRGQSPTLPHGRTSPHAENHKPGDIFIMTTTTSLAEIARRDLANFSDRIVGPGDPGYDEARAVHNAMIDRHPALIVRCATADD